MDPEGTEGIGAFLLAGARVEAVERNVEEWPDEDAFGNPGTTAVERARAVARSSRDGEDVAEWYAEEGFTRLPGDARREDERLRLHRILTDESNPFLREHVVEVGVAWRELLAAQRSVLERKREDLRRELDGRRISRRRRAKAVRMLEELEEGLLTVVRVESRRRIFRADPVLDESATVGRLLPLGRFDQIVYTVRSRGGGGDDDEPVEPMYLTILGTDGYSVAFLYTGGIVGYRVINDLDAGRTHHAWFRNRGSDRTDDTAPWVSRAVYRELVERKETGLVVRRERDPTPVPLRLAGEEVVTLDTPEGDREVPAVVALSAKDDRLWILADEESPLVLRMVETGADLLRAVVGIRRLAL